MNEEAELEHFRALETLRSTSEARKDRLVEQIQGLQRQMQEMQLQLQRLQSQGSAETDGCAAVATLGGNKESSVPSGGNVTGGHSKDQQTVVTLVAKPAQSDSRLDLIKSADPQVASNIAAAQTNQPLKRAGVTPFTTEKTSQGSASYNIQQQHIRLTHKHKKGVLWQRVWVNLCFLLSL